MAFNGRLPQGAELGSIRSKAGSAQITGIKVSAPGVSSEAHPGVGKDQEQDQDQDQDQDKDQDQPDPLSCDQPNCWCPFCADASLLSAGHFQRLWEWEQGIHTWRELSCCPVPLLTSAPASFQH